MIDSINYQIAFIIHTGSIQQKTRVYTPLDSGSSVINLPIDLMHMNGSKYG